MSEANRGVAYCSRLVIPPLLGAAIIVSAGTGCARAAVETEVNEDGTWTRTLTLRVTVMDEQGGLPFTPPKLEDYFELPTGDEWETQQKKEEGDLVFTAKRTLQNGESIRGDLIIKKGDKPILINEVTVREIAPGRYEYREVLRWQGDPPSGYAEFDPDITKAIKNALPENLHESPAVSEIMDSIKREIWRMFFGPGDPIIGQLLTHPDLAEKKMKRSLGKLLVAALVEKLGNKLPERERAATARAILDGLMLEKMIRNEQPSPEPPEPGGSDDQPTPLYLSVKLPGRIVETNGELDELAGEVFWALYPQAAAPGEVVLRAVCDLGK